jgi:putative DNA primase/helicase
MIETDNKLRIAVPENFTGFGDAEIQKEFESLYGRFGDVENLLFLLACVCISRAADYPHENLIQFGIRHNYEWSIPALNDAIHEAEQAVEWGCAVFTKIPTNVVETPDDERALARIVLDTHKHPEALGVRYHGDRVYTFGRNGWQPHSLDDWKSENYATIKNHLTRFADKLASDKEAARGQAVKVKIPKVTNALLANVDTALRSETRFAGPGWIDGSGDDGHYLSFTNGIYHLQSGELLPHTPRYFSPYTLGYAFEHTDREPTALLAMLRQQMQDDEIEYLQEFSGLCLIPETKYERGLLIYGPNRSGKGTYLKALVKAIGERNYVAKELYNFGSRWALDNVPGKLLLGFPDERKEQNRDTSGGVSRLLKLISGDPMDVQRKYVDSSTEQLVARTIILANYLPELPDEANALRARLAILKTRKSFEGQENRSLLAEITADMPAFVCWALRGLTRLQERGDFILPDNGVMREYSLVNAPITTFVRERCDRSGETPKAKLFAEYQEYMVAHGQQSVNEEKFFHDLYSNFADLRQTRPTIDGKRVYCVQGLSVRAA